MILLYALLTAVLILGLATIIDRKISDKTSTVLKFLSLAITTALIVFSLLLYGEDLIQTFTRGPLNNNEFNKFAWSKIVAVAAALFVWVFILIRSIHVTLSISMSEGSTSETKATSIARVVFDIAVIPNIVVLSMENVLFVLPLLLSVLELGLVSSKLVFSNTFLSSKEALA